MAVDQAALAVFRGGRAWRRCGDPAPGSVRLVPGFAAAAFPFLRFLP